MWISLLNSWSQDYILHAFICFNARITCVLFGMLIDRLSFHLERKGDGEKDPWNLKLFN